MLVEPKERGNSKNKAMRFLRLGDWLNTDTFIYRIKRWLTFVLDMMNFSSIRQVAEMKS